MLNNGNSLMQENNSGNQQKPSGGNDDNNKGNFNGPGKPNNEAEWGKYVRFALVTMFILFGVAALFNFMEEDTSNGNLVRFDTYEKLLKDGKIVKAEIIKSDINDYRFVGELRNEEKVEVDGQFLSTKKIAVTMVEPVVQKQVEILNQQNIQYKFIKESNEWMTIFLSALPWVLIIGFYFLFMRRMQSGGGGSRGIFNFGKSKAKMINEKGMKITFKDVAGADEAKQELHEVIDFLKEPSKFQKLGGKIPRGVLLLGPPGTGKTLLARAVAGEAGVPFFSISGADFVEMFVGVGASRVRDLFDQGKKSAPCIIFIDEIDAVGRHRGAGLGGGHDEREQTLNALLVEMDGFEQNSGVIIIAATNRPDVLDPALLRPGRFDRQVVVDRPDVQGREGILKVHTSKTPLAADVDLKVLAKGTPGLAGAELANLVNEAALLAARKNKPRVSMVDFEEAKDKVMMGMERKSLIITEEEKKSTAYHEIGHVLVAKMIPEADPVHKVTIIPRGRALGVTSYLPIDEKHTHSKDYLEAVITYALGGRAAEKLIFNQFNTGAGNDIERATGIAHKMICEWGMSEKLGPIAFGKNEEEIFLGREITKHKDYSERTAQEIDDEIRSLMTKCMNRAEQILKDNIEILHALSKELLEREILDSEEIDKIMKGEELPPLVKEDQPEGEVPEHVKKLIEAKEERKAAEEKGELNNNTNDDDDDKETN